ARSRAVRSTSLGGPPAHPRAPPPPRDPPRGPTRSSHRHGRGCSRRACPTGGARLLPHALLMRVLVTRPEPDALKLRAALEQRGHEATGTPLLTPSFSTPPALPPPPPPA